MADGTTPQFRMPLRYHGGKWRMAPWLISHFPPHRIYTEAFGGAASVLLQKPRCHSEVYNDLDTGMVGLFRVLRDPAARARLEQLLVLTPYAREEFELAYDVSECPIESARRLVIRAQMGFGSGGATKNCTGFRLDAKRKKGGIPHHLWQSMPETVAAIGERFSGVLIENRDAPLVLLEHDTPETLHYVDPPYLMETRNTNGRAVYRHEMDEAGHIQLLATLANLSGMVILSGYHSDLYAEALEGWIQVERQVQAAGQLGGVTRLEVLWLNPAAVARLDHGGLFGCL